jgi:hypothetical protein
MLADVYSTNALGQLAQGVLAEGRSRASILNFIQEQLPRWRDRPDRPPRTNETALTSQLCAHLNSATRKAPGWDCLQFRVEETDETQASRKIDLVAAAAGDSLLVQGRSYSDFETILPIECKRLPIPVGNKREECEYVATHRGAAGGIQRYKEGKHGASHDRAALIAYVQEHDFDFWFAQIGEWILDMHNAGIPGWSPTDALVGDGQDLVNGIAAHESVHNRGSLPAIHLRHLWVNMSR